MNKYLRGEAGKMTKEMLVEYADFLSKSFWTHQGQWMVHVNQRYGTEVAAEFDHIVFSKSAEVQAYRLKKLFNLQGTISDLIRVMNLSTIWSNVDFEWLDIKEDSARLRITNCIMQKNRLMLGLPELPCKDPAIGVNMGVTSAINPEIRTTCIFCPPDKNEEGRWCEWFFELKAH